MTDIETIREAFGSIRCDFHVNEVTGATLVPLDQGHWMKGGGFAYGQTGFFRHHDISKLIVKELQERQRKTHKPLRILIAPSSIGCEAYTFAALAVQSGLDKMTDIRIDAFDLSAKFTDIARMGAYPSKMVSKDRLRGILFTPPNPGDEFMHIREDVKSCIRFLDAQSLEDFEPEENYDVMMVNNVFQYMNYEQTLDSQKVINKVGADIVIFTKDDLNFAIWNPMTEFPYHNVGTDPSMKGSALASSPLHSRYAIMSRDEGPR